MKDSWKSVCSDAPSFEKDKSISVRNGSKNEPWDTLRVSLGASTASQRKKHWTDSSMFILYNSDIQRRFTSRPNFSGIRVVNRL